jgi:hypothetical protein
VLLGEEEKQSRCWKGYEPVPGKAPYSNDSCRPVGGKNKKKQEKKSADQEPCCDEASVPEHEATEKTKQIKPKNTETTHEESVITGDLGQKASASKMFHHVKKNLEAVVNNNKPSSAGKHVDVVHHDMKQDDGGHMKPEGAHMTAEPKACS